VLKTQICVTHPQCVKILVNIILPPKNADTFVITAWVTHFCCNAETTISQCPLPSFPHFSIAIVATSVILFLAKIMFMAFSSVNIWRVFLAKSCPYGIVALRNISVHGLATMQCCKPKHRARCTLHGIHLNNVTGVKTWGTLTMFQTWCPSPLPLTISQVPCRIQSFLREL